jgi:hypothetical protein
MLDHNMSIRVTTNIKLSRFCGSHPNIIKKIPLLSYRINLSLSLKHISQTIAAYSKKILHLPMTFRDYECDLP